MMMWYIHIYIYALWYVHTFTAHNNACRTEPHVPRVGTSLDVKSCVNTSVLLSFKFKHTWGDGRSGWRSIYAQPTLRHDSVLSRAEDIASSCAIRSDACARFVWVCSVGVLCMRLRMRFRMWCAYAFAARRFRMQCEMLQWG